MAAKNIKGITIEIGGDTTKLSKALSGANNSCSSLQRELKEVDKLLKLDPTNTELLTQKQKILKDAIGSTKEKLDTLKEAEKQVQEQFERGEVSEEQYRGLQREIASTEQQLKELEQAAKGSNNTLEKIGDVTGKIGEKATDLGNKLKPVSAAAAAAGTASIVSASNFEDAMAKVSTIADSSKVSIDDMSDASGSVGGYMKDTVMTKAGRFPVTYTGSSSTYLCDYFWLNTGIVAVPLVGGSCTNGLNCGACVYLHDTAGVAYWAFAPGLSCKMPNAA